jgi:N-acetylmuramoyl-L-alanine amidase
MKHIREIIVHCTATPEGRNVTAKDIDNWHRQRGWRCIGYHYVVRLDGRVEPGRGESETGAHCVGHNSISIGVVYAGGLDGKGQPADTRTEQQKVALRSLLTELKARYPQSEIHGHRDFAAKACPCFDATAEYSDL